MTRSDGPPETKPPDLDAVFSAITYMWDEWSRAVRSEWERSLTLIEESAKPGGVEPASELVNCSLRAWKIAVDAAAGAVEVAAAMIPDRDDVDFLMFAPIESNVEGQPRQMLERLALGREPAEGRSATTPLKKRFAGTSVWVQLPTSAHAPSLKLVGLTRLGEPMKPPPQQPGPEVQANDPWYRVRISSISPVRKRGWYTGWVQDQQHCWPCEVYIYTST